MTDLEVALQWSEKEKQIRADVMPTEKDALSVMAQAYQRSQELGFKAAMYCPKDGTVFDAIEPGSTGIHKTIYDNGERIGRYWVQSHGDLWPSTPCLFREIKP